jgi:hypothetical protein
MKRYKVLAIIGLVLICVAISINRSVLPKPTPLKLGPYHYCGAFTVQKLAATLHGQGKIVIWQPVLSPPSFRYQAILDGFRQELKKTKGIAIVTEIKDRQPTGEPYSEFNAVTLSADRLHELLAKYSEADVLMVFAAIPQVQRLDVSQLPKRRPRLFVATLGVRDLDRAIFRNPLFCGVVLPRTRLDLGSDPLQTDADKFNAYYEYIAPR